MDICANSQADPDQLCKGVVFRRIRIQITNADSVSRYGRYRILPVAGNEYLDEAGTAAKSPDFLFEEIKTRVAKKPVRFCIAVQLAETRDTTDDAAVRSPGDRPQLAFGEIGLTEIAPNNAAEQQHIIFAPTLASMVSSLPRILFSSHEQTSI